MMRASMVVFFSCLGWFAGFDARNAQAGVFCHNNSCCGSCCSLVARPMAAPLATNFAAPAPAAVASTVAAENPVPATFAYAYVVQSGVPAGPHWVVYGIPQSYLGESAGADAPRVFQNLFDESQRINALLGAAAQPGAAIQVVAPSGDLAMMHQDIRNLQNDVAMLKNRCLFNQGGNLASNTPAAPSAPSPPASEVASPAGSSDVARLAAQIQRLGDVLTEQGRRLDQLTADVQGLKAHAAAVSGGAPAAPSAAR
jgi:hypothetical protein